ncbi:MAG: ABC transporter permease [Firmicutes bacterium]|nr:ABC transporter permease [Bacillota bacterium]
MRIVRTVAGNQLLRLVTDRQALFLLLAVPLALNFILGVSLQRAFSPDFKPDRPYRVALAAAQNNAAAPHFREVLRSAQEYGLITVREAVDEAQARRLVTERRTEAAVVLPPEFPARPALVIAEPGTVASAVVEQVVRTAAAAVVEPEAAAVPVRLDVVAVKPHRGATRQPGATEYYAPGMSVLMIYFAARYGTLSYLRDRATGVYLRVRASGVSRASYLLGKLAGNLVVTFLFMVAMTVATRLLFGVHWGDVRGWTLLTVAASLAAAGLNATLMALIRTPEVMDGVSAGLFQVLGFLGGSMLPLYIFPDVLARISHVVPNRWMLDGYLTLLGGGGPSDVAGDASKLAVAGFCLFALGWIIDGLHARSVGEA